MISSCPVFDFGGKIALDNPRIGGSYFQIGNRKGIDTFFPSPRLILLAVCFRYPPIKRKLHNKSSSVVNVFKNDIFFDGFFNGFSPDELFQFLLEFFSSFGEQGFHDFVVRGVDPVGFTILFLCCPGN